MQLSVSTSPVDPSLATLLPGGDLPCPASSGGNATSFGAQFPLLASTPSAIPAEASVAPVLAEPAPTWIGSTIPQAIAQPRLPALPGKSAAPFAAITAETPDDVFPSSVTDVVAVTTPTHASTAATDPASGRPAPRRARHDETTLAPGANPLSAEMAQALSLAPVPADSAPVALVLAATAPAEDPVTTNATVSTPLTPSPLRGTAAPASPPAVATPSAPAVATADSIGPASGGPRSASNRSARDFGSFSTEVISTDIAETPTALPLPAADVADAPSATPCALATPSLASNSVALNIPVPLTTVFAVVPEPHPVVGLEEFATALGETPPAVRSFAPGEIHSRQFSFTSLQSSSADLAAPYGTSRAVPFVPSAVIVPPVTASPVVDGAALTPPPRALPPPFAAAAPAQSALQPLVPVADAAVEVASAITLGAVESSVLAPREFVPNSRAEKASPGRGAKIAATGEFASSGKIRGENGIDKTFVNVSSERVAGSGATVGTDVAKSEVTMSAPFNHPPASAAVLEHAPVALVATQAADRSVEFSATSVLAPETTEAAHRAVEAVLTTVERFSTGDRHSVNLNFSVGGNDLNVRVELRDDEVHATFLTDSPELRTALAHEWQAARGTTDSGERSLRLVTPVFASHAASSSSTSSSLTSFSGGDSSSRQRESGARRSAADFAAVSGVRASGARSSTLGAVADSTSASSVARSAPPTSHRLHTHA